MCKLEEGENMISAEGDDEQKEFMLCSFKDGKMHESVLSCSVVSKGILGSNWHLRFEAVVKGPQRGVFSMPKRIRNKGIIKSLIRQISFIFLPRV